MESKDERDRCRARDLRQSWLGAALRDCGVLIHPDAGKEDALDSNAQVPLVEDRLDARAFGSSLFMRDLPTRQARLLRTFLGSQERAACDVLLWLQSRPSTSLATYVDFTSALSAAVEKGFLSQVLQEYAPNTAIQQRKGQLRDPALRAAVHRAALRYGSTRSLKGVSKVAHELGVAKALRADRQEELSWLHRYWSASCHAMDGGKVFIVAADGSSFGGVSRVNACLMRGDTGVAAWLPPQALLSRGCLHGSGKVHCAGCKFVGLVRHWGWEGRGRGSRCACHGKLLPRP